MDKKERKYLRSAYHHYEDDMVLNSNNPSVEELKKLINAAKVMREVVFHVLSLSGDMDGQSEELLKDIVEENRIPIL